MAEYVTIKPADWRINSYDLGVDGVDPITSEGTEVPKSKVASVEKAAEEQGLELSKED